VAFNIKMEGKSIGGGIQLKSGGNEKKRREKRIGGGI
jgi:hypothetical protein